MKICPCASSSGGNMYLISHDKQHIIIDAGISGTAMMKHFEAQGGTAEELLGIFITHSHTDHCGGLETFYKKLSSKLEKNHSKLVKDLEKQWKKEGITDGTAPEAPTPCGLYGLKKTLIPICHRVEALEVYGKTIQDAPITLGKFTITPFPVTHDVDCCGFVVEVAGEKMALMTDLGQVEDSVFDMVKEATLLVIEANYEDEMLWNNQHYRIEDKRRITGPRGHLSNEDMAGTVVDLLEHGLKTVILAHLSKENNSPQTAKQAIVDELQLCHLPTDAVEIWVAPVSGPEFFLDVTTGENLFPEKEASLC